MAIQNKRYYPQIDFLKGIAITSVILLHSASSPILARVYADFYIAQAVPIFIILSGLIGYIIFQCNPFKTLNQVYSKDFFLKRISRYIFPLVLIYVIDLIYMYLSKIPLTNDVITRIITLQLPTAGPGNYYISIIMQIIIISPVLFYVYSKKPFATLVTMVALNATFEFLGPYIPYAIYYVSFLRYFAAFALGMYLSKEFVQKQEIKLTKKSNLPLIVLIFLSAVYMFTFHITDFAFFRPEWNAQNLFTFSYAILPIAIVLSTYPVLSKLALFTSKVRLLGRASYHIFLVQILYFGTGLNNFFLLESSPLLIIGVVSIMANLTITITFGLLFYFLNQKLIKR